MADKFHSDLAKNIATIRKNAPTHTEGMSDQEVLDFAYQHLGGDMSLTEFRVWMGADPKLSMLEKAQGMAEAFFSSATGFGDEALDSLTAGFTPENQQAIVEAAQQAREGGGGFLETTQAVHGAQDAAYERARAERAEREARFRDLSPTLGTVADVLGGVAAASRIGPVAYGALVGGGQAPEGERLRGAATGAAVGGALGLAGRAIGGAAQRLAQPMTRVNVGTGLQRAGQTLERVTAPVDKFVRQNRTILGLGAMGGAMANPGAVAGILGAGLARKLATTGAQRVGGRIARGGAEALQSPVEVAKKAVQLRRNAILGTRVGSGAILGAAVDDEIETQNERELRERQKAERYRALAEERGRRILEGEE